MSKVDQRSQQQENVEILKRAARTAQDTVNVANDNLHVLATQGEQINQIETSLDNTKAKLNVAQHILKTMSGVKGALYGLMFSAPKAEETPTTANKPTTPTSRRVQVGEKTQTSTSKSKAMQQQSTAPTNTTAGRSDEDLLLDSIANSVALLKNNATVTGRVLEEQNTQLRRVENKTDEVTAMVRSAANKTKRIS
eukprot:PhF_6_TR9916/c0_g1_i1/m.15103